MDLLVADRLPEIEEGCHLLGSQLAETAEILDAGEVIDTDEREPGIATLLTGETIEEIDEDELAGEVVLEPEHHFIMLPYSPERLFLTAKIVAALVAIGLVRPRDISGPHLEPFIEIYSTWGRSRQKRFPPWKMFPRQIGALQDIRRGVAIMNVKHEEK
jgi:hypothetical protein